MGRKTAPCSDLEFLEGYQEVGDEGTTWDQHSGLSNSLGNTTQVAEFEAP
jgi:hypothetical protein